MNMLDGIDKSSYLLTDHYSTPSSNFCHILIFSPPIIVYFGDNGSHARVTVVSRIEKCLDLGSL